MDADECDRFIETWGSMGVLWGINRSMARIHALILLSGDPVDLDTVANRLNISRGNVSMCLKELRNWGVIHRVHTPGDRRDFYTTEPDVWKMLYHIAVERKKREFDPALHALRNFLLETDMEDVPAVSERLIEMEALMSTFDRLIEKILKDEKRSKNMLDFFNTFTSD